MHAPAAAAAAAPAAAVCLPPPAAASTACPDVYLLWILNPHLQHYLNYEGLKRAIKACAKAQQEEAAAATAAAAPAASGAEQAAGDEQRAAASRLLDARKAAFQKQLDGEVLKVLAFYQQRSRELVQVSFAAPKSVEAAMVNRGLCSACLQTAAATNCCLTRAAAQRQATGGRRSRTHCAITHGLLAGWLAGCLFQLLAAGGGASCGQ